MGLQRTKIYYEVTHDKGTGRVLEIRFFPAFYDQGKNDQFEIIQELAEVVRTSG